jgi:hypothetical protein
LLKDNLPVLSAGSGDPAIDGNLDDPRNHVMGFLIMQIQSRVGTRRDEILTDPILRGGRRPALNMYIPVHLQIPGS